MKKIAIVGAPGTGKTTICRGVALELGKKGFNVGQAAEFAYDYCNEYGQPTHWLEQMEIFKGERKREKSLKHCDFIVCDAAMFLAIVYMRLMTPQKGDFRGDVNRYYSELKKYRFAEKELFGYTQEVEDEYDYIFFLPKEFPMKKDGVRWQKDDKEAEDISRRIKGLLDFMGWRHYGITGSIDERIKKILNLVLYTYKTRI